MHRILPWWARLGFSFKFMALFLGADLSFSYRIFVVLFAEICGSSGLGFPPFSKKSSYIWSLKSG